MGVRLTGDAFARLVTAAIERIPTPLSSYLHDVAIDIEPRPDRALCDSLDIDDPTELLGAYVGTPLTERGLEMEPAFGDRIVIFQRNIEEMCDSPDEVVEQIRLTVLHEIGHHFGLDEDELTDLGYE